MTGRYRRVTRHRFEDAPWSYGPVYGLEEPSSAVGRRPVPTLVGSRFPCMCYRDTSPWLLLNVGPVRFGAESPNRERDSFPNLAGLALA
jgi:hypothetical protein